MPFLNANGIKIRYLDEGQGPAIVWTPGGNIHAEMAMRPHRRLTDRYRMIVVDPRGQGGSTAFNHADSYDSSQFVEDLRGVLDALELQTAIVGGHSRGGLRSLQFARAYPTRARAVIAVAAPAMGGQGQRAESHFRTAAKLRAEGIDTFLDTVPGAPRNPAVRAEWEGYLRAAGIEAIAAQWEALARVPPITDDTRGLTMPILLVCGERDGTIADLRALEAAVSSSRLVTIPGAGHVPYADAPDLYFAALEPFLAEVTAQLVRSGGEG